MLALLLFFANLRLARNTSCIARGATKKKAKHTKVSRGLALEHGKQQKTVLPQRLFEGAEAGEDRRTARDSGLPARPIRQPANRPPAEAKARFTTWACNKSKRTSRVEGRSRSATGFRRKAAKLPRPMRSACGTLWPVSSHFPLGVGCLPSPFAVRADLFDSDAPRWNAYARTNLGSNTFLLLARIASGSVEKTSSFVVLGLDALPYRFLFALRSRSRTFGL